MAKENEIDYINQVAKVECLPVEEFRRYLSTKPFSDPRCGDYLMDIAQIIRLLPPPPARLLDVGVGSGWTSELFAMRGYEVLGVDINPDMIELANSRSGKAGYAVCDYEVGPIPGVFDIAVIYDALHHATDEFAALRNICNALSNDGILITIEPGVGHSTAAESVEVMRKYGTTEKDMPFYHQRELMHKAGFGVVEQYMRISQLPFENISTQKGALGQVRHGLSLAYGSATGLTSVVIARKSGSASLRSDDNKIADSLLKLSVVHDNFVQGAKFSGYASCMKALRRFWPGRFKSPAM